MYVYMYEYLSLYIYIYMFTCGTEVAHAAANPSRPLIIKLYHHYCN